MPSNRSLLGTLVVCASSASAFAQCGVFSGTQGEDGFYAGYREAGGPFRLMEQFLPTPIECGEWTVDAQRFNTRVARSILTPNGPNVPPPLLPTAHEAVLRYVVPADGFLRVVGQAALMTRGCSSGGFWSLRHNQREIAAGSADRDDCYPAFTLYTWPVRAGDTLDLGVRSGDGAAACDRTRAWFTVEHVSPCVADVDDGSSTGTPDNAVTIDDLLFYLTLFEAGDGRADIDFGCLCCDQGVTIDDLLLFIDRFAGGC